MNEKEKSIIKHYKKIKEEYPNFLTALIILLNSIWIVPILIWFIYLLGDLGYGIPTQITAGDLLSFYGVIMSTLLALVTIIISVEQYRSDKISMVKPYLQSSIEMLTSKEQLFKFSNNAMFLNYPYGEVGAVGFSSGYNNNIFQKKENELIDTSNYVVFAYTLTNVGAGNAVGVEFGIDDHEIAIPKFCVGIERNLIFVFVIGEKKRSSNIEMTFRYQDIYGRRKYLQKQSISIVIDNAGEMSISYTPEDQISEPNIIN